MQDLDYMKICLKLACKCQKYDDVPVGAIIVKNGVIVAKAYNQKEKRNSTISHAEILAIEKANKVLGANLSGCTLFTTKEPCLMCMGAILSARIDKVVFGAYDLRFGTQDIATNNNFNHKCEIVGGVLKDECSEILTNFFKSLRQKNGSKNQIKN
ncbi:MAG: nucleoside deaminase [Firmicutes bacterium]|nr:nucleoside deaminase [Bacillota bacterium]